MDKKKYLPCNECGVPILRKFKKLGNGKLLDITNIFCSQNCRLDAEFGYEEDW